MDSFLMISFVPILLAIAQCRENVWTSVDVGRRLHNRFHRLRNGHAGTSSSLVGFTLKAQLFLNILLGFYNRKSIYHN